MINFFDRAKSFKHVTLHKLMPKVPIVVELELIANTGWIAEKAHNRDCDLNAVMTDLAIFLCNSVPTVKVGYATSTKLWLILTDTERPETAALMGGVSSKIISMVTSAASVEFNELLLEQFPEEANDEAPTLFFAQAYNVPFNELPMFFGSQQAAFGASSLTNYARYRTDIGAEAGKMSSSAIRDRLMEDHGIDWYSSSEGWMRNGTMVTHNILSTPEDPTTWRAFVAPPFNKDRKVIPDSIHHKIAHLRLKRAAVEAKTAEINAARDAWNAANPSD